MPRVAAEKAKRKKKKEKSRKNNICFHRHRKCESFRIEKRKLSGLFGAFATFRFTERTSSLISPMRLGEFPDDRASKIVEIINERAEPKEI